MAGYQFYYPIQVRWMDLDTQWHVNNARFLSYLESGRLAYIRHLGLWNGGSFMEIGTIVADVHLAFRAPISIDQHIRVAVRVTKIGHKSMVFESQIEDSDTAQVLATSETVLVSYDYRSKSTVPVPENWRAAISTFEGIARG